MNFYKTKKNKGFTLVEALFAVVILTFTIAGLMKIISSSLFSARYSKDEITVNYLLQEVIDYVRNDRDATVFLGGTWNDFKAHYDKCLVGPTNTDGCYFDVLKKIKKTDIIHSCADETERNCSSKYLYYDKTAREGSFYNYTETLPSEKTNFIRKIVLEEKNPNELVFTVIISWKNGSSPVSRSLSTSLTNWR